MADRLCKLDIGVLGIVLVKLTTDYEAFRRKVVICALHLLISLDGLLISTLDVPILNHHLVPGVVVLARLWRLD